MIKFEPSPKITRKNWTWSTRRKKQKNKDIKKLKFYWINLYRDTSDSNQPHAPEIKPLPPEKCNCIVCRYMLNKKKIIKIEEFF